MLDIHSGIINIFSLSTWGKLMVWVTLIELDNKNKCFYNYYSKAREGWKDVQCREIHRPRQITWASLISRVCLWMGYDISGAPKKRKHTQQLKVVVTSLVPLPFLNPRFPVSCPPVLTGWVSLPAVFFPSAGRCFLLSTQPLSAFYQ